jgi:hypothetical protein
LVGHLGTEAGTTCFARDDEHQLTQARDDHSLGHGDAEAPSVHGSQSAAMCTEARANS